MPITSKQRAQLRGLAMEEDTIIQVGKGGITENLVASVNAALKARELGVPVKFVGVGEGMDDLLPFESKNFVEALFK